MDNHPNDSYVYEIFVQTGYKSGAATTADVFIVLHGTQGETPPRKLCNPSRQCFMKGEIDVFLLTTPYGLGPLKQVEVWHNNSGSSPGWFLLLIQVSFTYGFFSDAFTNSRSYPGSCLLFAFFKKSSLPCRQLFFIMIVISGVSKRCCDKKPRYRRFANLLFRLKTYSQTGGTGFCATNGLMWQKMMARLVAYWLAQKEMICLSSTLFSLRLHVKISLMATSGFL